jgi:rare lipoprotein A
VEVRAVQGPAPPVRSAAAPRAVDGGGTYLQVGAFGQRENADRMLRELQPALDAPVRVFEDTGHSPPLYKVQLGPILDPGHAERLVAALGGIGIARHQFVTH